MGIESAYNFIAINAGLTTSGLPTLEQLEGLEGEGYAYLINLLPDDSEYAVAGETDAVQAQNLDYTYIPVDYAKPLASDFKAFVEALDRAGEQKVHIHCAANYRVSVFYGMYACLKGQWSRQQMDEHISRLLQLDEHPPWPDFIEEVLTAGLQ